MSMEELQKQTNTNVQEKANLIWDIATHLYGQYKPHEYGRVILPMTVIKRFDDSLKDTKAKVLEVAKRLDESGATGMAREAILKKTSGRDFYNVSKFDFEKLLADSTNAERPGYTKTEQSVFETFEHFFSVAENDRLIIATFASNISRVQQIINCAVRHGRKVAFSGRSMLNVMGIAAGVLDGGAYFQPVAHDGGVGP